jgi:predicted Zn-ribbon and HTH transcriptional regulator
VTEPFPPPERAETAREELLRALSSTPATARCLSQAAGLSEKEVFHHLAHLQKSLKAQHRRLKVTPAACLDCQYVFQKRDRLTRPGKCPICRSTHLSEPLFSID